MNKLEIAINNIKTIDDFRDAQMADGPFASEEENIIAAASNEELINAIKKLERYDLLFGIYGGFNTITNQEEIIKLIKENKISAADLTDLGICPTCFDKENGGILYGDNADKLIYEDEMFECFFVGNPRANGHTAISTKMHFKDMMEIDDETCEKIFILAKKTMVALKEIYNAESVYLCTMCDGPMNHFHLQLIPRYDFEKRGSKNFVKQRTEYVEDKEKILKLRSKLNI